MPSRTADAEPIDLFFPSSPEESEALERARSVQPLSPEEYLQFLMTYIDEHPPSREIPEFHEPFVL